MRNLLKFAAVTLAVAASSTALRAENNCKGKIIVDSIHQVSNSGDEEQPFAYYIKVRNETEYLTKFTIKFGKFDTGVFKGKVTLFTSTYNDQSLKGRKEMELKFGKGTSQEMNTGEVERIFTSSGSKAYVSLTDCVVAMH